MGVGMYPPLYMSDRTPSRILLKSDVQPRSQGLSSLTSRFDVSSEVITKCMYLVAKYRRHTDPDGRYDQNEIKRSKGLKYFEQNCPIFRFAIQTFLRG